MTNKPVFLHWAHKMMWALLAQYPTWSKKKALQHIQKMYPDIITQIPRSCCFACQSRHDYHAVANGIGESHNCAEQCPLFWGNDGMECFVNNSIFDRWLRAVQRKKYKSAAKYARRMVYIPLRESAHKLYDVKESPNE